MTPEQRITEIEQRLKQAFAPTQLQVIDDSHKHIGHAGASGGAGHYMVIIAAPNFDSLSRIESHRKIYAALQDLIPQEIHALQIKIQQNT